MGWESEQENKTEPVDNAKRVWYGILVAMVIMFIAMAVMHEDTGVNSRVKVQHIFVEVLESQEEALGKIQDIKQQLDEGGDFEELANRFSDDLGSNKLGGMVGWVERGETTDEFDDYIWVGEIGVVSDPVKSELGYHLILILEREISDAELYQINLNERLNKMNQPKEQ